MKDIQEHGGVLTGGKDMLLSKMLFEPFMEFWNNQSYFGNEIWDTNAPGYQQVQQALRHIVSQQLSPMSVSGARRTERSMGMEPKWLPTTKEGALSYLGFGPAPKYAEASALRNRIGHLYRADEANTHERLVARNNCCWPNRAATPIKSRLPPKPCSLQGTKMPYIRSTLQGEQGDQRMFKQLPANGTRPARPNSTVISRATPRKRRSDNIRRQRQRPRRLKGLCDGWLAVWPVRSSSSPAGTTWPSTASCSR
jgi:hypothetical protein